MKEMREGKCVKGEVCVVTVRKKNSMWEYSIIIAEKNRKG
jgi:hypothetical protein